jgi:hypothetical protein
MENVLGTESRNRFRTPLFFLSMASSYRAIYSDRDSNQTSGRASANKKPNPLKPGEAMGGPASSTSASPGRANAIATVTRLAIRLIQGSGTDP